MTRKISVLENIRSSRQRPQLRVKTMKKKTTPRGKSTPIRPSVSADSAITTDAPQ